MPPPAETTTLEELLALLPGIGELEVLRIGLTRSAVADPTRAWDSSSVYATVDKRIVSAEAAERALDEAEAAMREYVTVLHAGLRPVLQRFYEGDADGAARHMVALGEEHERGGRTKSARDCYGTALQLSLPLPDKAVQILALRRYGRSALTLADFQDAALHYERSAKLARDSEDLQGEVVARTGMGNVRSMQGRWTEAEESYREALALALERSESSLLLEQGQLYNNLGSVSTRLHRLEDAEAWFARALATWEVVSSPLDLSVCLLHLAALREAQGDNAGARRSYERAMELPIPSSLAAVIAADFADLCMREGHTTQAQELGRLAEEHAIAAGSPYSLGRMYQARGNIARDHDDGFIFFEKALAIAREKGYLFLEGQSLADYAEFRLRTGGVEEAEAYLERAREIFVELGAVLDLARTERLLAGIAASARPAAEMETAAD